MHPGIEACLLPAVPLQMEVCGLALAAVMLAMAVSRGMGQCCPEGLCVLALVWPGVAGLHPSCLGLDAQGCVCCHKDSKWAPWSCVQATPRSWPMDFVVLPESVLAGRGVPGLAIPLLVWESGLVLHKQLYQRLSVLSAQHLPNPRC